MHDTKTGQYDALVTLAKPAHIQGVRGEAEFMSSEATMRLLVPRVFDLNVTAVCSSLRARLFGERFRAASMCPQQNGVSP